MEAYYFENSNYSYYVGVTSRSKSIFFHCKIHIREKEYPNNLIKIKHIAERRETVLSMCRGNVDKANDCFVMMALGRVLGMSYEVAGIDLKNKENGEGQYLSLLEQHDNYVS